MLTYCKCFLSVSLAAAGLSACSLHAQVLIPASADVSGAAVTSTAPVPAPTLRPPTGRLFNLSVREGMLVVDGWVAKVHLNYGIRKQGYLYFFVPGVGTALVSLEPMAGAERIRGAFNGRDLQFTLSSHTFQLTNQRTMLPANTDVYIRLDQTTLYLDAYPMMGFGQTDQAPYNWPLSSMPAQESAGRLAPPLPPSILPRTLR